MANLTLIKTENKSESALDAFAKVFYLFNGLTKYPPKDGSPAMIVYTLRGKERDRVQTIKDAEKLVSKNGYPLEVITNGTFWNSFVVREAVA